MAGDTNIVRPKRTVSGHALYLRDDNASVVPRSNCLLKATQVLDDIALDRYSFVRDAYLQRRGSFGNAAEYEVLTPEPAGAPASSPAKARVKRANPNKYNTRRKSLGSSALGTITGSMNASSP